MKRLEIGLQTVDWTGGFWGRILKHMKVAIYTRVSTGKQDTENQAAQLRERSATAWESRPNSFR
jgi:hypothetical protein